MCMQNWVCASQRDNLRQKAWDSSHDVMIIALPSPLCNVESTHFRFSLLQPPNIAWWGRGRDWMLGDSLSFTPKKALFHYVKMKLCTVNIIHRYGVTVPTTFGDDCVQICLTKTYRFRVSFITLKV